MPTYEVEGQIRNMASVKDLATMCGVSDRTVMRWIARQDIPDADSIGEDQKLLWTGQQAQQILKWWMKQTHRRGRTKSTRSDLPDGAS